MLTALGFACLFWEVVTRGAHGARQAYDGTRYEKLFKCEVLERRPNQGDAVFMQNGRLAEAKWYVYDMTWIVFPSRELDRQYNGWHHPGTSACALAGPLPYAMLAPMYNQAGWGNIIAHEHIVGRMSSDVYDYVLLSRDKKETAFGVCHEVGPQPPADPPCVLM